MVWETEAMPVLEGGRVTGVEAGGDAVDAAMTVVAAGAQGRRQAARRRTGSRRTVRPGDPHLRRHAPRRAHLEACLSLRDEHGTPIPGYGWMFPAGDGTVNIGVGALSTMKGFRKLNLNTLLEAVPARWCRRLGARPGPRTAPCVAPADESALRRHGPGWVAIGDAAGFDQPDER